MQKEKLHRRRRTGHKKYTRKKKQNGNHRRSGDDVRTLQDYSKSGVGGRWLLRASKQTMDPGEGKVQLRVTKKEFPTQQYLLYTLTGFTRRSTKGIGAKKNSFLNVRIVNLYKEGTSCSKTGVSMANYKWKKKKKIGKTGGGKNQELI